MLFSRFILITLICAIPALGAIARTIYVDSKFGDDVDPGTKQKPLRSLSKAAQIVNSKSQSDPATIKVQPGIYSLEKSVVFDRADRFTEKQRLIIEASILPDDPNWTPASMPVILSEEDPRKPGRLNSHTETYGIRIKVSHVTIRGLKFLGNPLTNNWHCGVSRIGENLKDLLITQCVFIGDTDGSSIYCGVLAVGDKFVVDHCIFYQCYAPVVLWDGPQNHIGRENAMRYCIVYGGYYSGAWTCDTAEDFKFHNNIVTNCEYLWIRKSSEKKIVYTLQDCLITDNRFYSGYGNPAGPSGLTGTEITFKEQNVVKTGQVVLEKNKKSKNYLHPVPGTAGSNLGAGLFKKRPNILGKETVLDER
jgi:hypothetical protein